MSAFHIAFHISFKIIILFMRYSSKIGHKICKIVVAIYKRQTRMFWLAVVSFAVAIFLSAVSLYKKTVERSMAPTELKQMTSPSTTGVVHSLNEKEGSIPNRIDPEDTELDLDPYNSVYKTARLTQEFDQERDIDAGKQPAQYKPSPQPPAGGEAKWFQQVTRWMEYALSPENGLVRELIKRRKQYLANMTDSSKSQKKQCEACTYFNEMNQKLRDKFLLPARDPLIFSDAIKNNDDVADFLRANNLME
jgi:hypothetical protein